MDLQEILKKYWGYDSFRPLQHEIIESVLAGRDTLAILPTGGGKSICFQVPALAREGICLVVSPLIALMKDQVENLRKRGIPALLIHSGMSRRDVIRILKNAGDSYFKFLYLSPERLETFLFREYLPSLDISLVAVDESHCISQWGYDFRPSYLRIAALREELPGVPVLALTASATRQVQQDICEKLHFRSPAVFRQSFARPNLSYSAFRVDARQARLVEILSRVEGTAIVYCKSRKRTVETARLLQMHGMSADYYHAGLAGDQRSRRQQDWIDNRTRIIVCTNAFGMGIDKADVRLVVHLDIPDCLENYYQEAGRAGRDGKKSYAVLLYHENDLEELARMHHQRYPPLEQIRKVYQALVNHLQIPVHEGEDQIYIFRFREFVSAFGLEATTTLYALKALEQDGWLEFDEKSFIPSTVVFTTGKQGLYDFYMDYPQHEELATTLLRMYEGIFDFPALISEAQLARQLGKDESTICEELQRIASYGILQYTAASTEPRVKFRKQRVAAQDLSFNLVQYNRRRELFMERCRSMREFAISGGCRSVYISQYFGEKNAPDCGVCDNCLKRRETPLSPGEFRQISGYILDYIHQHACTADQLAAMFSHTRREKFWEVLNYLQQESRLTITPEGILHKKD